MFAGVAPRYDLLNHVLSGWLDRSWRKTAARSVAESAPPGPVLDLCCGTGDQAIAIRSAGRQVFASDFCLPMLLRAGGKRAADGRRIAGLALSDALSPPFSPASFSAVTVSFGVRNVADLDLALRRMHELLKPGGRVVVLEFALPRFAPLRALYMAYFRFVLPGIARLLSGRGAAYRYLRDSVLDFPQRDGFTEHLEEAGFSDARWSDLSAGTVCLYTATRGDGDS
jgi:demethylmenaquinone methyltransferase/2-methoxy-6-polyprenyl-1,4-benzoquinol methylase